MKIDFKAFWQRVLHPPTWAKFLTILLTVISATLSLLILLIEYQGTWLEILAYVLFGLAGLTLAYSVYLIIPLFPKIKNAIVTFLEKREFTNSLLRDFGFRTLIFSIGSFLMSLFFGVFNAYMGSANRSIWYGALAAFYIALIFIRGGVLFYYRNKIGKNPKAKHSEYLKAKVYRNSGIIMLILNVALSAAIAQMIFSNAHFSYMGWTIFAYAAYAFYKITMAIISFVKAQKQEELTVRAVRNINLIDAIVSILALQTALLTTFANGEVNVSLANTLTGIAVSLICITIGVYTVVSATKKMKEIQKENNKDE